ncbi:MAG: type II toxin-antitoxin system RelB/DinJ family antitoxin [Lentilactobacillus hilgardii]|uniref:type II toxin-antitoxin system RelB/DinJ family antitoxin n=1 Tax=Lactobacillaceae TaxID=33958 RepID=UPI00301DB51A
MTTKVNLNIKIDPELKKQADLMLDDMGLTTSAAVNMFFRRIIATGQLPFTPQVNDQTRLAIQNVNNGVNLSQRFETVDELLEDLNS